MGPEAGLKHYLHVLRRGWWIIVLTAGLSTTAAIYARLGRHRSTARRRTSF